MNYALRLTRMLVGVLCLLGAMASVDTARAESKGGKKIEMILVWGTDMAESPNADHKPLPADLAKSLKKCFKWKNYFLVNKSNVTVPDKGTIKEKLSDKCQVQLKDLGDSNFQVDLWGEEKHVIKKTQKIIKGELLTLGGDVKDGAWFIMIREHD